MKFNQLLAILAIGVTTQSLAWTLFGSNESKNKVRQNFMGSITSNWDVTFDPMQGNKAQYQSHGIAGWCTRKVHASIPGMSGELVVKTPGWSSCQSFTAKTYDKTDKDGKPMLCLWVQEGGQADKIAGVAGAILGAIGSAAMASQGYYVPGPTSVSTTSNLATKEKCAYIDDLKAGKKID
ncbi:MAG TPA: hypothetical protein VFF04_05095 [Candidatus Babeliales bacterium]|nr:hypothetical protein [Candidatus Babeliales bacterium]